VRRQHGQQPADLLFANQHQDQIILLVSWNFSHRRNVSDGSHAGDRIFQHNSMFLDLHQPLAAG
jgi:hypothetical protein